MKHKLKNDGYRFWTGNIEGKWQILLGPCLPNLFVFYFDLQGSYVKKEKIAIDPPPVWDGKGKFFKTDSTFLANMNAQVLKIQEALKIIPGDVEIDAFYDDETSTGTLPLPWEYEEFLKHPESFSDEERAYLPAEIERWKNEERFVFVWGDPLWMDKDGEILAT